jgi:membrane protease YdiL (CAAX protease family)
MMNPPEPDPNDPYPSVRAAFALTLMALVASFFTTVALFEFGALAAYGVGRAVGVGAIASMAAQRVAEPQAARLGLRRLEWEAIPLILCLIPTILLMSEIDNYAFDYAGDEPSLLESLEGLNAEHSAVGTEDSDTPASGSEPESSAQALINEYESNSEGPTATGQDGPPRMIDPEDPASMIQGFIVMVGIIPIVDCFLFFGVIQQGLIRRMGLVRGALIAGLFWMLMRDVPVLGMTRFLIGSVALLGLGWLLGVVRVATGSILAPILLASAWAAVGFFSLASQGVIDVEGMNVDGTHLPVLVTIASAVMVAWAGSTMFQEAQKQHAVEAAEDASPPQQDEGDSPFGPH